jgi:membrane-bound lytic murein transglycosylase MltF
MDQSRWQKIEPILDKALTFTDQQQQEAFVKKVCEPNRKLYKQVTSLLSSIREANTENFLEEH